MVKFQVFLFKYMYTLCGHISTFQVFSCFKLKKKQAQEFLNNFQLLILTTLFAQ